MPQGRSPILELHQGSRRPSAASRRCAGSTSRSPPARSMVSSARTAREKHADEDHRRRACGILGPFRARWPGDPLSIGPRRARGRYRHGASGAQRCARSVGGRERVSRRQPTNRFGVVQWRRMAREAREQLARFGIDADPLSRLGDLPIGLQQLIEIARVLSSGARIIILDEPTSALSPPEVERLFATLRRLRDEGTGIVFISHFIEDILRVSDTVTVFRNGRKVVGHAGGRDQQGRPDRSDDRQGRRDAGRKLHRRNSAAAAERSAGGVEGRPALARPQPAGRLVPGALRRSPRHLRLHGLRAARTGANPVRQARARPAARLSSATTKGPSAAPPMQGGPE